MRPRMLFCRKGVFYDIHPMERRLRSPCFGRTAHLLWGGSAALIVAAFAAFGGGSALSLAASLVGVTSLIFNAKGHPVGHPLVFVRVLRRNDCLPGHDRADGRRAGCVLHGGAGLLRAVFGERFVRIPLLAANADGAGGVKGDAAMVGNYKTGSFQRPFAAFLPHFCRRIHPCRTLAAAVLHPNAPKIPFEKRYKKCRFIAIYRDKPAFSPWSWWTGSNPRPADYKSAALPTELHQHICLFS